MPRLKEGQEVVVRAVITEVSKRDDWLTVKPKRSDVAFRVPRVDIMQFPIEGDDGQQRAIYDVK